MPHFLGGVFVEPPPRGFGSIKDQLGGLFFRQHAEFLDNIDPDKKASRPKNRSKMAGLSLFFGRAGDLTAPRVVRA